MSSSLRRALRGPYRWFSNQLFDPLEAANRLRALPWFFTNWRKYEAANTDARFRVTIGDLWYRAHDRFSQAGSAQGHYFFQDLWAAQRVRDSGVRHHVDVGSRIDGFIAHIVGFCDVTYVDIRPLTLRWPRFEFRQGSVTQLPFATHSVPSLSCLHVLEHIGLGRYADPVDPLGHVKAGAELARVLAPGGRLLLGTPVGRERVCFDAHRVFDPQTVVNVFHELDLKEFVLIDDQGEGLCTDPDFSKARACEYGCGLFVLERPGPPGISSPFATSE